MKSIMNVENFAFCEIEIEDTAIPPTKNLISSAMIQEGIGIALPTLTLILFDQGGSLMSDLNLTDGKKCSVKLTHDPKKDKIVKYEFRLWGMKRGMDSQGPHLQLVFVLDAPLWGAASVCENFKGTSNMAMSQMASKAGLTYSGTSTDDKMNWLNINTTRSSFSEDVAMRGYAGQNSCMIRVLAADKELLYKDLNAQLSKAPSVTFGLSTEERGANFYSVRETKDRSISGAMNHWFNYGHSHFVHDLSGKQKEFRSLVAPQFGSALPINSEVKGKVKKSRVSYAGYDPGTEPKPASNIHKNYEQAFYQNMRFLGLFSERMSVMTDKYVNGLKTLDSVEYRQKIQEGNNFIENQAVTGRWIVAGKTIRLKHGHVFSEVIDLIRPYIKEAGKSPMHGDKPSVKANPSNQAAVDSRVAALDDKLSNQPLPQTATAAAESAKPKADLVSSSKPYAQTAKELLETAVAYDKFNPAIPKIPSPVSGLSSTDAQVQLADKLNQALETAKKGTSLDKIMEFSKDKFDTIKDSLYTIKKIAAAVTELNASNTIDIIKKDGLKALKDPYVRENLKQILQTTIFERAAPLDDIFLKSPLNTVISKAKALGVKAGDLLGDVRGGLMSSDFLENGIDLPSMDSIKDFLSQSNFPSLPDIDLPNFGLSDLNLSELGKTIMPLDFSEMLPDIDPSQWLKDISGPFTQSNIDWPSFDVSGLDINFEPVKEWVEVTGKDIADGLGSLFAYPNEKFGEVVNAFSPKDVASFVKDMVGDNPDATRMLTKLGVSEFIDAYGNMNLSEATDLNKNLIKLSEKVFERYGDNEFIVKHKSKIQDVIVEKLGGKISDLLDGQPTEALKSSFDFMFGDIEIVPITEQASKITIPNPLSDAAFISTERATISWSQLAKIGNAAAKAASSGDWQTPEVFEIYDSTIGEGFGLPTSTTIVNTISETKEKLDSIKSKVDSVKKKVSKYL